MSYYSQYGHRDFVLCLGYKPNVIKEFFVELPAAHLRRLRRYRAPATASRPWAIPGAGLAALP